MYFALLVSVDHQGAVFVLIPSGDKYERNRGDSHHLFYSTIQVRTYLEKHNFMLSVTEFYDVYDISKKRNVAARPSNLAILSSRVLASVSYQHEQL